MKINKSNCIYFGLSFLVIMVLIYGILFGDSSLINLIKSEKWRLDNYWQVYMWFTFFSCILLYKCRKYIIKLKSCNICFLIFMVAFIIRGLAAVLYEWTPFSDFSIYFNIGGCITQKNYSDVAAICEATKIPSFGGLAVLNAVISWLFSHTLFGFQIGHSILTSCSAVCLYKIGELFDRKMGVVAGFIFAFYPSNIIMSQISNNQHGANLCYLIAIYFILKWDFKDLSVKQIVYRYVWIGVILGIGYYFHPSAIMMLVALLFWFGSKIIFTKKLGNLLKIGVIIISYYLFIKLVMFGLLQVGIVTSTESGSMWGKFVVGLNQETSGTYSGEDYTAIGDAENPTQLAMELIRERTQDMKAVISLFANKTRSLLFGQDTSFWWYVMGDYTKNMQYEGGSIEAILANAKYNKMEHVVSAFGVWDQYYSFYIYIFAIIGLVALGKSKENISRVQLLLWTTLGWTSFFIITEVQPRYRYFIMPYMFLYAAGGIVAFKRKLNNVKKLQNL